MCAIACACMWECVCVHVCGNSVHVGMYMYALYVCLWTMFMWVCMCVFTVMSGLLVLLMHKLVLSWFGGLLTTEGFREGRIVQLTITSVHHFFSSLFWWALSSWLCTHWLMNWSDVGYKSRRVGLVTELVKTLLVICDVADCVVLRACVSFPFSSLVLLFWYWNKYIQLTLLTHH